MQEVRKTGTLNRLQTVRRHLDAVIKVTDDDRYEIMKQVSHPRDWGRR